jgi:hypothetical protein
VFGGAGTLLTWFFAWLKTRKNISIRIIKICKIKGLLVMYASIINRSGTPITIENISVIIDGNVFSCYEFPTKIFTRTKSTGQTVTDTEDYLTIQFPISLSSLAGKSGYFAFEIQQEDLEKLSTPLIVQVSSNRGKTIEKKLAFERETDWMDMI